MPPFRGSDRNVGRPCGGGWRPVHLEQPGQVRLERFLYRRRLHRVSGGRILVDGGFRLHEARCEKIISLSLKLYRFALIFSEGQGFYDVKPISYDVPIASAF